MAYWYQAFCYSTYLDVACIVNGGGPAWTGHLATVCLISVPRGALCTRPIGPGACGKLHCGVAVRAVGRHSVSVLY